MRANRTIALVKHLFNLAIRWEMRAGNPAIGIEWNHEEPVERYLTPDELNRLFGPSPRIVIRRQLVPSH